MNYKQDFNQPLINSKFAINYVDKISLTFTEYSSTFWDPKFDENFNLYSGDYLAFPMAGNEETTQRGKYQTFEEDVQYRLDETLGTSQATVQETKANLFFKNF